MVGTCRAEDVVARWGHDEVAILTPNTPADRAEAIADRLRDEVAGLRLAHHGQPVAITATFTISDVSADIESALESIDAPPPHPSVAAHGTAA